MFIHDPKLPPKRGYVEVETSTGDRIYNKINNVIAYFKETIEVDSSKTICIPESRDQLFTVKLVGGGSGLSSNSEKGSDGAVVIKELQLDTGSEVPVLIGSGGLASGGTTSFGTYFCALGGSINDTSGFNNGEIYGKGADSNSSATDGVCIIEYDAPIYE